MKEINKTLVCCLACYFLACSNKKEIPKEAFEVTHIHTEQVVDELEPPPPGLASDFKTIQEWLFHVVDTEKPDTSIILYKLGLFETEKDYVLVLTGSKHSADSDSLTIDFQPSTMYYPLADSAYRRLSREQVIRKISTEIEGVKKTTKFNQSFFAKAAFTTDFGAVHFVRYE
jgi:hypothetical protein